MKNNIWTHTAAQNAKYTHSITARHSLKDSNIFQLTHSLSMKSLPLAKLIWGVVLHFPFSSLLFFSSEDLYIRFCKAEAVTHFISLKLARSIVSIPSLGHWPEGVPPQRPAPNQPHPPQNLFLYQQEKWAKTLATLRKNKEYLFTCVFLVKLLTPTDCS